MKKIGILSDTHGFIDDGIINFFKDCDEVWHAGDIGEILIFNHFENKTIRAVNGNIDGTKIKFEFPDFLTFECENHKVIITHIAIQSGRYNKFTDSLIRKYSPTILLCGHSHILKVFFDKNHNLLFINPGAAGKQGFHVVRTAIRLIIDKAQIRDLEIIELPRGI